MLRIDVINTIILGTYQLAHIISYNLLYNSTMSDSVSVKQLNYKL